jgi:oxygen-independent coproporphyrinogen-3 oxidase
MINLSPLNQVSLYIHIPFCLKKCGYCDFFSLENQSKEVMSGVLTETLNQARWFLQKLGNPAISTIFIGGGTPSLLPLTLLKHLLDSLQSMTQSTKNSAPVEWSIEANPESITPDFLSIINESGVNRLSLGIQSMDNHILALLERTGNREDSLRAIELIKESWKGDLSIDLITGIPEQTKELFKADIQKILEFEPDHVSLYGLQIEEGTPFFTRVRSGRIIPLADGKVRILLEQAEEMLLAAGYEKYELSNYSKPGKACRHNLGYWRMDPYLGCGPSGASTLPGIDKQGRKEVLRLEVPRSFALFLEGEKFLWGMFRSTLRVKKLQSLSKKEFLFENLMMGFRLTSGISWENLELRFGNEVLSRIYPRMNSWKEKGYLKEDGKALTREGTFIMNNLLLELLDDLESVPEEIITLSW